MPSETTKDYYKVVSLMGRTLGTTEELTKAQRWLGLYFNAKWVVLHHADGREEVVDERKEL